MLDSNIKFQEKYKRLDVLCKDMFSRDVDVSRYIREMENTPFNIKRNVLNWEENYKLVL